MTTRSRTMWQVFQAIEHDDDGHILWNLLEQTTPTGEGITYMTFAGETPQSLADKLGRQRLSKLIQLHSNLTCIRAQFE